MLCDTGIILIYFALSQCEVLLLCLFTQVSCLDLKMHHVCSCNVLLVNCYELLGGLLEMVRFGALHFCFIQLCYSFVL